LLQALQYQTLAGQIIMEGYLNLRIQPYVASLRLIAIVSGYCITIFGEGVTGKLLIFSNFEFAIGVCPPDSLCE
jgi:Mn2+/Fe2+ NRAMP family transporter